MVQGPSARWPRTNFCESCCRGRAVQLVGVELMMAGPPDAGGTLGDAKAFPLAADNTRYALRGSYGLGELSRGKLWRGQKEEERRCGERGGLGCPLEKSFAGSPHPVERPNVGSVRGEEGEFKGKGARRGDGVGQSGRQPFPRGPPGAGEVWLGSGGLSKKRAGAWEIKRGGRRRKGLAWKLLYAE